MADGQESRKHRLLLELGRGGMGTVYLAATRGPAGFEKLKVIKRLHSGMVDDAQFLTMFLEEARLAARLNHPNIVQTNEVGFDGRDYFIEMEYLEGQSLDVVMRRASKASGLSTVLAVWVLTQVLAGLHYAHTLADRGGRPLGIVHRDVSPHNVFVTYDGVVKVLDFGIAKAADSSSETRSGLVKGKATYMSPEQATRKPVDGRADVFAVGVMTWEALTRKRLWEALQDGEIFQKLAAGEIPRAREVDAAVDVRLDAICAKALSVDVEKRWASAGEMQEALEEWLEAQSERFGQRGLAKWMGEVFGERRKAVAAEVAERLQELAIEGERPRDIDVPALGRSVAYQATVTGDTRRFGQRGPAETSAASPQSLRGIALREPSADATRTGSAAITTNTPSPRARTTWKAWKLYAAIGAAATLAAGIGVGVWVVRPGAHDVPPAAWRCAANADCHASGTICRTTDGACVSLKSDDCRMILGDPAAVESDATVWIGVMIPNGDDAPADFQSHVRACELARRDFDDVAGGLPAVDARTGRRALAFLVCDDTVDAERAARHLAEDIKVPAVIGFRDGQEAVQVLTRELLPQRVLSMVPLTTSALVTTVPQPEGGPRLVWRTTYSNAEASLTLAALLPGVLEPRVRARATAPDEPVRVAVLRQSSSTGLAFSDRLFSALRFNGKSALENGKSYREVVMETSARDRDASIVEQLLAFAPHVILHSGSEAFPDRVFAPLEQRWPAAARARPFYAAGSELGPASVRFARSRADLLARFVGVTTASATDANAKFVMRYNAAFPEDPRTRTLAPNTTYDAVYALAYAIVATGKAHPSGSEIAEALPRIMAGEEAVDVGPTRVFDAFRLLRSGGGVRLNGTAGPLEWDTRTGEVAFTYAVLCVTREGEAEGTRESGMTFDARSGRLDGGLRCE